MISAEELTELEDRGLGLEAARKRATFKMHKKRRAFLASRKRFDMIPAGRRSGKTEEARWRLIAGTKHRGGPHHGCLTPPPGVKDPTYVYAAPTYQQAKRIVWEAFKREIPKWAIAKKSESELWIDFITGARLYVVGMDQPQRVEGIPIDGAAIDEFADMKPQAWTSSIRPALDTEGRPPGWAVFIGRPRGKNHFWDLFVRAQKADEQEWGVYYPWPSWLIMSPEKVEQARRDLDARSFAQEYGGEFVDSAGRAYYQFGPHNLRELAYDPHRPLQFSFDFNNNPGVAAVSQDMDQAVEMFVCPECRAPRPGSSGEQCGYCHTVLPFETVTAVIGEVFRWNIPSNTRMVCEELIEAWGDVHRGPVVCYGDATGGANKTSAERSDWQTIEDYLSRQWPVFEIDVPSGNPPVRDRVVVMNSRLRNAGDEVRIYVDPEKAPNLCADFEKTMIKDSGDLDPGPEKKYGHITDGFGYLQFQRFGSAAQSTHKELEMTPIG